MLNLNGTQVNIDEIESVGFNTTDGRYALLSNGTKVAITFAERQLIIDAQEAAESLLPPDHLIDDYIEYHANRGEWSG